MRIVLAIFAFVLLTAVLQAQGPSAIWNTPDVPATAQAYTYVFKNGATVVAIGPVTCAVVGASTQCSAPITGTLGVGSYTITASNAFGSAVSDPFVAGVPAKPTGLVIK